MTGQPMVKQLNSDAQDNIAALAALAALAARWGSGHSPLASGLRTITQKNDRLSS